MSKPIYEQDNKPSFYAVIPANVRYDERLIDGAKLLFGEITALCNTEGYCWANNHYFANLYKVTTRTIQEWVILLENCEYIHREYIYRPGTKEIKGRKIYLGPLGGEAAVLGVVKKSSRGGEEIFTHNNTKNNNNKEVSTKDEVGETRETRRRGSRVPTDFEVSENIKLWAKTKAPDVDLEEEKEWFVDHWSGISGKDGVKSDWEATFRNSLRRKQKWILKDKDKNGKPGKQGSTSRAFETIQVEGEGDFD